MTERELIEMAAKAAGLAGNYYNGDRTMAAHFATLDNAGRIIKWNPLSSDGDALRLAVRLGINIYLDDDEECSTEWNSRQEWAYVEGGTDMWAAVRLAITRAAAEIGRTMP